MAEQRLQTSEQKLRLYVEQTPLAVISLTESGVVTEWNPSAERMFGYAREVAVGQPLDSLILMPSGHADRHLVDEMIVNLLHRRGAIARLITTGRRTVGRCCASGITRH